jgi:glycosyltransferase involved in cell wall biosynthesis
MNILYVNHYAGSPRHGMEFRPFYFARQWLADGHDVTIAAASQSHVRSKQPSVGFLPKEERVEGVRYFWLPTNSYQGNGLGRMINMLAFLTWLVVLAPWFALRRPDVVVASSTYPLDIFPCWLIARLGGAKLVFEVHDLWPLAPIEVGGYSPSHPYIRLIQFAEDFACRRSDKIVSILPKAKEHLMSRGMAAEKFHHVPNGIEMDEWTDVEPLGGEHVATLANLRAQGTFLVGYVGAHGLSNALEVLLGAAALLKNEKVAFVFVGKGPEREKLIAQAKDAGLTNALFLGSVPKRQVPELLANVDALCIALHGSPLYRFGISPNKLFDYMMSGKPIIQAIAAGNDLVAEAGCGFSPAPEDPQALAEAVRRLRALPAAEREAMGQRGRDFVMANHLTSVLARKFLA